MRSPTCRACRARSRDASTTNPGSAGSKRKSNGGSTDGKRSRRSAERPTEELVDGTLAVWQHLARAGAGEVRVGDQRCVRGAALLPVFARPREPAVLLLIEHVQRLVA